MLRRRRRAHLRLRRAVDVGRALAARRRCACPSSAARCATRCARGWRGRASARSAAGLWITPARRPRGASCATWRPTGSVAELLSFRAELGALGDPGARSSPRRGTSTAVADAYRTLHRPLRPPAAERRPRPSSAPRPRSCTTGASSRSWTPTCPRRCCRPAGRARRRAHDLFAERHAAWHEPAQAYFARSRRAATRARRGARPELRARSPRGPPRSRSRTRGSATGEVMICPPHCRRARRRRRRRTGRSAGAHGVQRRVGVPARPVRRLGQRRPPRPRPQQRDEPGAHLLALRGGVAAHHPELDGARVARVVGRPGPAARLLPGLAEPARRAASRSPPPARHSRLAHASACTRCEPSSWRILRARWAIGSTELSRAARRRRSSARRRRAGWRR